MIRAAMCLLALSAPGLAQIMPSVVAPPEAGSVSQADGLAAWARVCEVVSHPRCASCHVGPDNLPMWSGPKYPRTRPHGMNISGGDSRIGAQSLPCAACRVTASTLDSAPRAAPNAMIDWRLAPVEMQWFGQSSAGICAQLSDPTRNGGRDWVELAGHLRDDAAHGGFVAWRFQTGGGADPRPVIYNSILTTS